MRSIVFVFLSFSAITFAQNSNSLLAVASPQGQLLQYHEFRSPNLYSAYELSKKLDCSIAGFAIASNAVARFVLLPHKPTYTEQDILNLKRSDIALGIDQSATYKSSVAALDWSNILGIAYPAAPLVFIPMMAKENDMWILYAMYLETFAVNLGVNEVVKSVVNRPRPELYNPDVSMQLKTEKGNDNLKSFYSEHTSNAFMTAVFLSKIYCDRGGEHPVLIISSTLAVAATIGVLRYESGKHFPTDIITGAVIGSAIGYLIPEMHRFNKEKATTTVSLMPMFYMDGTQGVSVTCRF